MTAAGSAGVGRREDGDSSVRKGGTALPSSTPPTPADTPAEMVPWGWDCIDCGGDYGVNDACDSCGGSNRIQLFTTAADAERFGESVYPPLHGEAS